jgi:hypothetical protein
LGTLSGARLSTVYILVYTPLYKYTVHVTTMSLLQW